MKKRFACILITVFLIAFGSIPVFAAYTYTLEDAGCGGNYATGNAKFNINGNELRTSEVLDWETDTSCSICIRTTDGEAATYDKEYEITINDNADIIINEVDSDTSGADTLEFVELYAGVAAATPLDGMTVAFFDGTTDQSYKAFDLDGETTNADGYYIIGNAAVPGVNTTFANGVLQDGADAVALYADDAASFPNGTVATATNLLDILVYDTDDTDDAALLTLLTGGGQINENQYGDCENDSMQRSPNGTGGKRDTSAYDTFEPTTKTMNTNTAPAVSSIVRADSNPTNDASVDFTVTFSEIVSGVDTGDFSLTPAGDAAGTVSNVAGSGNTRTVTVNSITGDGTLRLDLSDNDTITDGVDYLGGAGVQNYTSGENYTIDNTAPGITSFARQTPASSPTNADTLVFRATFDEDVQNVGVTDFAVTGTTAIVTGVAVVTATAFDLTVSGGDLAGLNGIVGIDLAGGQDIRDLVSNALPAGEPATDETYTVDNSAPTVIINQAAAQADPGTSSPINFTITFSETVTGFDNTADVALSGTASATTSVITGTGPHNVAVSGMSSDGTVIANINSAVAQDAAGNGNAASVSTDNQVTYSPPEMALSQGVKPIADGGSQDFGSQLVSSDTDLVFTITNSGTSDLTLTTPLTIGGANANQFSIQAHPSSPVSLGGGTTTFIVRFAPTSVGAKTATISIANTDGDENPYNLTITGTGTIMPDLHVTKTNNKGGIVSLGDDWIWTVNVSNTGTADATFTNGQTILSDNLPNTNIGYSVPTAALNDVNITNTGNISTTLVGNDLTISAAGGSVTIGAGTGSFDIQFTATPTLEGSFVNPRGGGNCTVDPNTLIAESNEGNNTATDTVITATLPTITTQAVTDITSTTASSGGNVTSNGGASVTTRGVCWNTSANPTIADNYTTDETGTGVFASSLTGLLANTPYYVRAYATNSEGTSYGNEVTFTTSEDGTGVLPGTQDAGPNGGDGNGDDILDSKQTTVASLPAATGEGYLTVEITGCDQLEQVAAYTYESVDINDPGHSYPFGLVGFRFSCSPVTVKIYYHGAESLDGYIYRKYGPTPADWGTSRWYTMTGVTFGTEEIGGETVPYVEFVLTVSLLGDDTYGFPIIDQGGPGLFDPTSIPTLSEWGMILFALLLAGTAVVFMRRRNMTA